VNEPETLTRDDLPDEPFRNDEIGEPLERDPEPEA
jgi:hypothetical protein